MLVGGSEQGELLSELYEQTPCVAGESGSNRLRSSHLQVILLVLFALLVLLVLPACELKTLAGCEAASKTLQDECHLQPCPQPEAVAMRSVPIVP